MMNRMNFSPQPRIDVQSPVQPVHCEAQCCMVQDKGRDPFWKGHVYLKLGRVEAWESEVHGVVKRYLAQEG